MARGRSRWRRAALVKALWDDPIAGFGHARERADLGVRELAASERPGQQRQRPERARHPHTLARRAEVEPAAPSGSWRRWGRIDAAVRTRD